MFQRVTAITTKIHIVSTPTKVVEPSDNVESENKCDTDANTCCLGSNCLILNYTNISTDIFTYEKSYEIIENVPIVTGKTSYDETITGVTSITITNESFYFETKLDHILINTNQFQQYREN